MLGWVGGWGGGSWGGRGESDLNASEQQWACGTGVGTTQSSL